MQNWICSYYMPTHTHVRIDMTPKCMRHFWNKTRLTYEVGTRVSFTWVKWLVLIINRQFFSYCHALTHTFSKGFIYERRNPTKSQASSTHIANTAPICHPDIGGGCQDLTPHIRLRRPNDMAQCGAHFFKHSS